MLYTDRRLSIVNFSHKDIGKNIQNLNPNKTHGHDYISICMLKNVWFIYLRTTRTNFQKSFKYWSVSIKIEKGIIVPIHKKGDKQILKN